MKVGWKFGIYIGVASGAGIILLFAIFLYIRYYYTRDAQKKSMFKNGIIGQLNLPQHVPDFTIPLMMPIFVQSNLSEEGAEVTDPVREKTCSVGSNLPVLVQPEESVNNLEDVESGTGPVIRRLESVMDVSMFPAQENDENRPEATGPWTSSRRESLFFPYLCGGRPSTRSTTTPTDESMPSPPSKFERRFTQKIRTQSTSSDADQKGSIRPRISSDASSIKRKITKPLLVKKTSCPESTTKTKVPFQKRFRESYRRQVSSDSLLGSLSSKELPASKRGNLALTVRQNVEEKTCIVHLVNATDLPMKNNNLLDTFARLYLIMPSKQLRQQSKVIKKTCNPIYDETFVFEDIEISELLQSHLRIKILHKDGFTRGEMIGELSIDLSEENVMNGEMIYRNLLPRATSVSEEGPGELLLSVCHHATTAQLKVLIMKMRDLPKSCKNPSVSVELVYQDELLQRQQTRSKKQRKKLVFNEEIVFHIPTSSSNPLENYTLQFSIFNQDILKGAVCLGYVTLGLDAPRESEVEHWKAVVSSPHKPVTAMHKFHRTPV